MMWHQLSPLATVGSKKNRILYACDSVGAKNGPAEPCGYTWAPTCGSINELRGPAEGGVYQYHTAMDQIAMVANKTMTATMTRMK